MASGNVFYTEADLQKKRVFELRAILHSLKKQVYGPKEVLIKRILDHYHKAPISRNEMANEITRLRSEISQMTSALTDEFRHTLMLFQSSPISGQTEKATEFEMPQVINPVIKQPTHALLKRKQPALQQNTVKFSERKEISMLNQKPCHSQTKCDVMSLDSFVPKVELYSDSVQGEQVVIRAGVHTKEKTHKSATAELYSPESKASNEHVSPVVSSCKRSVSASSTQLPSHITHQGHTYALCDDAMSTSIPVAPTAAPSVIQKCVPQSSVYTATDGNMMHHKPLAFSAGDDNSRLEYESRYIANAIIATKMPCPEPTVFNGEPIKYRDWNKSFTRFIDSNLTLDNDAKLFYLWKYTSGEAQELVEGYYSLDDDDAYDTVRALLHDRYGNAHRIALAYRERLRQWKPIAEDDYRGLQRLSDFLVNIRTAMRSVPNLSELNHSSENAKIKRLLPQWLARKWNSTAVVYERTHNEFPPFSDFVDLVQHHSMIVNHPISTEGQAGQSSTVISHSKSKSHAEVSPLSNPVAHKVDVSMGASSDDLACVCCDKRHYLHLCNTFRYKPFDERFKIAKDNHLCFLCLRANHSSPSCPLKDKIKCRVCEGAHNSLLHRQTKTGNSSGLKPESHPQQTGKPMEATTSNATHTIRCHTTGNDSSLILPVFLSHKDNPDHAVYTLAMLDYQSDISFVTYDAARLISNENTPDDFKMSTMFSDNEPVSCFTFDNLVVRGYNCTTQYDLPVCKGRTHVPHNLKAPTSFDVQQWPHISDIANEFASELPSSVGLMIGRDCIEAIGPQSSRPGKDGSPFAVLTNLGWALIGPVAKGQVHKLSMTSPLASHNVVTLKVPDILQIPPCESTVSHSQIVHIVAKDDEEESGVLSAVPLDVVLRLESGFAMPADKSMKSSSQDDLFFLKTLSDNIFQGSDGYYSMPLPFRDGKIPEFPDNRSQALSRLKALDKRFSKDPSLFAKYNEFIEGLVAKGDAEIVPADEMNVNNVWYLPHHPVINPNKPGKVRVVFDASCTYRGACLNKSLLSGPDLNNSLVGVLTRFREKEVAIACDVESMFYRFKVYNPHRYLLRFLL